MKTERNRIAEELRAEGRELAENIRADADKQRTIILANATRESERIRGRVMQSPLLLMPMHLIGIQNMTLHVV